MRRRTVASESIEYSVSLWKRFHSALGFRFPLPRAGEGQGEGVLGWSSHQRGSLTLALSQGERVKKAQAFITSQEATLMSGIKIGIGFGQWKYGLPEPEALCVYAEVAEAVGLDSIWLSDHIVTRNPTLDIACLFAMVAARTKRVKMGPSVLTLPARHPIQVAKTYATLDYLSGGRMIMAVGSGSDPRDLVACGVPPQERGKRLDEGIVVLRKLWTESHVTHHGQFYHFDDVTIE